MNGVLRLDLLTRSERDRIEREFARVPAGIDGRNRFGDDCPEPRSRRGIWAQATRRNQQHLRRAA
jgi:ribosome modulation factor